MAAAEYVYHTACPWCRAACTRQDLEQEHRVSMVAGVGQRHRVGTDQIQ